MESRPVAGVPSCLRPQLRRSCLSRKAQATTAARSPSRAGESGSALATHVSTLGVGSHESSTVVRPAAYARKVTARVADCADAARGGSDALLDLGAI
jgi:hypothetical protein